LIEQSNIYVHSLKATASAQLMDMVLSTKTI